MTPFGGKLRRIWTRAGIVWRIPARRRAGACRESLGALDRNRDRRAIAQSIERSARAQAPVYVMPNGERPSRGVAVARADPTPVDGSTGNSALFWWCGILAVVTIAGAAAQTLQAYATRGGRRGIMSSTIARLARALAYGRRRSARIEQRRALVSRLVRDAPEDDRRQCAGRSHRRHRHGMAPCAGLAMLVLGLMVFWLLAVSRRGATYVRVPLLLIRMRLPASTPPAAPSPWGGIRFS
jgi:hypothetical protein